MSVAPKSPLEVGVQNSTSHKQKCGDFFLWGFVKDTVFVPPVPADLQELCDRITAAVALIDRGMLTSVWNEFDYQLDVCRISQNGHIELL